MKKKFRASLAIGAFTILATACSPSSGIQGGNAGTDPTSQCTTVCQGESKCSQITNCTSYCNSLASVASSADCNSQFSAYMGCASGAASCSVGTSCKNQQSSFSDCAQMYCATNASDANCGALSQPL